MIEIVNAIVGPIAAALGGLMVWNIKESKKSVRESKESKDMVMSSVRALLRSQLLTMHRGFARREGISVSEREEYYDTYNLYKKFKGNGLIDRVTREIDEIPLVYNDVTDRKGE